MVSVSNSAIMPRSIAGRTGVGSSAAVGGVCSGAAVDGVCSGTAVDGVCSGAAVGGVCTLSAGFPVFVVLLLSVPGAVPPGVVVSAAGVPGVVLSGVAPAGFSGSVCAGISNSPSEITASTISGSAFSSAKRTILSWFSAPISSISLSRMRTTTSLAGLIGWPFARMRISRHFVYRIMEGMQLRRLPVFVLRSAVSVSFTERVAPSGIWASAVYVTVTA